MNIAADIINLRREKGLDPIGVGETYDTLIPWYQILLMMGLVETVYKDGEIQGFIEWIKIDEIPADKYNVKIDISRIKTAPILLVINCIARDKETFKELKKRLAQREPYDQVHPYTVWHRRGEAKNKFSIHRRVK